MIFVPDDLSDLSHTRLDLLNLQLLAAIKREIEANPRLKRLCAQSDRIEDEQARRFAEGARKWTP